MEGVRMSLTILTVDDSRVMRQKLRQALVLAGFNVVQAEDGAHGLEVLKTERPDVIVTDINMPGMDGFAFIEGVRADRRNQAIPILVLSTEGNAERRTRARQAGAAAWVFKPFDPAKLVDAILRVA
jgi:two-component system chemotaxis response regulator CheY